MSAKATTPDLTPVLHDLVEELDRLNALVTAIGLAFIRKGLSADLTPEADRWFSETVRSVRAARKRQRHGQ